MLSTRRCPVRTAGTPSSACSTACRMPTPSSATSFSIVSCSTPQNPPPISGMVSAPNSKDAPRAMPKIRSKPSSATTAQALIPMHRVSRFGNKLHARHPQKPSRQQCQSKSAGRAVWPVSLPHWRLCLPVPVPVFGTLAAAFSPKPWNWPKYRPNTPK